MSFISVQQITISGARPADGADISSDGRFISYFEYSTSGSPTVEMRAVTIDRSHLFAFPAARFSVDPATSTTSGIDGGVLSSTGRYLFYSAGATNGDFMPGFDTHISIVDLQSA